MGDLQIFPVQTNITLIIASTSSGFSIRTSKFKYLFLTIGRDDFQAIPANQHIFIADICQTSVGYGSSGLFYDQFVPFWKVRAALQGI